MRIIDNTLYIEYAECISSGIKENTLKIANHRNSNAWRFINDPDDSRKVLVEYERMQPRYKEMIQKRFGNPYEYVAKEPIRKMIKRDLKAHEYYLQYRFDGDKCLPIEHVEKYTAAAEWLNMLQEVGEDKKALKKLLNLSIGEFWLKVCEVITSDNIDLPRSYRRLREKIAAYQQGGYPSLIHSSFGSGSNAAKVVTEESKALLLEMIAHPNQFDDVYICAMYNGWALKNGHKSISPSTVYNWRKDNEHLIIAQRKGPEAFNEKYIRQVKGLKPTTPLRLVESDDYWLNYLYEGYDKKGKVNKFKRYISYVVADSYNGLVLGKSYIQSGGPIVEMVGMAYIDAMYYIRSLTGDWYLPFELKTDNWGEATLFPFFRKIGKHIPAGNGNKHRGYIEQLFGSPLAKRAEKLGGDNYNGNNMTAVHRGVNMKALEASEKNRPMVGYEAEQQVEQFFHNMRHMPDITRTNMNALSKEKQWLAAWEQMPAGAKNRISDEQFLSIFGIRHKPQGRPITITNRGIEPQINNVKYSYDLPDYETMIQYIGRKVTVVFDPYDMSRVLITNDDDIRFIARDSRLSPRALADTSTGSREYLNDILSIKVNQVTTVTNAAMRRQAILSDDFSAADVLLMGSQRKEMKNHAEQILIEKGSGEYNPLDDM